MKRKELKGDAAKPDSFENFVIENAIGPILVLGSPPTTAGNQLPHHGDAGTNGGNLYVRLGATIYRFTGAAV